MSGASHPSPRTESSDVSVLRSLRRMKRRITVALDDEPDSSLSIRQLQSELGDEVSARVLEGLLGSEDILLDNGSNNDDNREEVGSINADDNSEEAEGSDSDDSSEDGEGIESDDSSEDGDDSDSDDSSDEGESSDDDEEEEEDEDEEEDEEEQEQEDEREEEDDNEAGGDSGLGIQPSPTRIVSGFITLVPGFQPTTIDDDTPPSPTSPVRPPESETPELPLVPIPPKPTTSVEIPAPQLTFSPAPPDKTTTSIADNVYQPTETPGRPVQTEETQPGSLDPLTGELRSGDSGMSNGAAVGITLGVLIFVSLVVVAIVLFYRRRVKRGMAGNEASNIDRSLSQTSQVPPPFPPTTQMVEARFTPPPPPPLQPPPLRPFNTFPAAPSSLRTWQTPSPDVPPEFATTGLFISQNPSSERVVTPVRPPVSAADYRGYLAAQPSGLAHEPVSPLSDYGSDNPVTSRQDETLTSASYNPRRYSQDLTAPSPGRWSLFPRTTRENDYYPPA